MGASIAEGGFDDDEEFAEAHEINVTPFIDVMLVLLIIFMVAAPLSTVDLPVDLPSSTATPQKKPDKPTYVSIRADLAVAIGETMVKRVDLVRALDAAPEAGKDRFIFLRADRAVPYGDMMDVLEILRAGGYSKIKLVVLEGVAENVPQPAPATDAVKP
ncbi:MAG: biopolymer transport protein ExbD [Bradyrhizobium sp.]|jgi:biopolymer transport protein ExbD|nr:biopolymer transport protein ExbD [Bradyrhizobium sp.]